MRLDLADVSRRGLLRAAACGAWAIAAVGRAQAKGKHSKADVGYRDTPNGVQRCEICAPFLPPDQCRTVAGPVSRQGWCTLYEGVT